MQAKIWNYKAWVIGVWEPTALQKVFDSLLREAGFEVLGTMGYHFQPFGYTGLWLLAESHFAIHTFPEEGKTYIELSSCVQSKQIKFERLWDRAQTKLGWEVQNHEL